MSLDGNKTPSTPIDCSALLSKNAVDISKPAKDFSSSPFWYYTSIATLNLILKDGKIWVSSLSKMNDLNEAQLHSAVKSDVYALCFCNTRSEKIPMWYLYGGICGKGMRIGLTPAKMLSFIKSIDKIYPIDSNNKVSIEPLLIGKDFDIDYGWIYYRKKNGNIKYKGKWYSINDNKDFSANNYFVKDYPWEYEKEFRIVFKNNSGNYIERIAIDIPQKIMNDLKISCAPEVKIEEEVVPLDGFQKYFCNKIEHSLLSIKMDLVSRNLSDIIENLKLIIDKNSARKICGIICSAELCKSNSAEG